MRLALAVAFLLGATPGKAPVPALPTLGETMDVSLVNVDVYVTDRKGNRVRGLSRDDFEIYDGGKRQQISNFAEYSSGDVSVEAATPRRASAAEPAPTQKRSVVLFLERMRMPEADAEQFIGGLRKTLRTVVREGDDVSLILWSLWKTERYEGLDEIDEALARVQPEFVGVMTDEESIARDLVRETRQFEAEAADFAASKGVAFLGPNPTNGADDMTTAGLRLALASEMRARCGALDSAISAIAAVEGKKILLLAPRVLGQHLLPQTANEPIDAWSRWDTETEPMVRPVLDNANASGVTIYPLYAPANRVRTATALTKSLEEKIDPTEYELSFLNQTASLDRIARVTGGLAAMSVADTIKLLPHIEEDITDYYSLAFRGDEKKKRDRIRDIVVRAKNPEYLVRSRRQYVEKSETTRMKDRVTAALTATPPDAFDITATTGTVTKARGRELVPVAIRIPVGALTALPEGAKKNGAFSVYVVAGSPRGLVTGVVQKTQPFSYDAAADPAAGYFTYNVDVEVEKNMDRIAVGVLDEVPKEYALLRIPLEDHAAK